MESQAQLTALQQQQQHWDRVAEMKSIVHEIETIYDAGTPIFTKHEMQKVGEELAVFRKGALDGRKINFKGINGAKVDIFIDPRKHDLSQSKSDMGSTWIIDYHSIQRLTNYSDPRHFVPQTAYLPMHITACTRELENAADDTKSTLVHSADDLSKVYKDAEREWRASKYHEQLQQVLAAVEVPFVLDKVIGFSLGPLSFGPHLINHSMIQHALISALHSNLLQCRTSSTCERYIQDPAYQKWHKDVLSREGFTVLDDPEAFLLVDESSILVSINSDIPVKEIVADICRPGIIVWDKEHDSHQIRETSTLFPLEATPIPADSYSSRVKKMLKEEYYQVDLPYDEFLGDLMMYIRKST
ncbi:hypothetical protein F5B20DRAFT_562147 [Whalleya microplaca]|nr:hypothetical protein F5B20DRAFT_562147 [Whalleya microplaca]